MTAPVYAGVDYGKRKLSIAIVRDDDTWLYNEEWVRPTSKRAILANGGPELLGDTLMRLDSIASPIFEIWRPTLVAVERPLSRTAGGNATMDLNEASGVLVLAARRYGAQVVRIASNTWKKGVCGNGGYDKEQVAAWVAANYPKVAAASVAQDDLDAFCLALAARLAAEEELVGAD